MIAAVSLRLLDNVALGHNGRFRRQLPNGSITLKRRRNPSRRRIRVEVRDRRAGEGGRLGRAGGLGDGIGAVDVGFEVDDPRDWQGVPDPRLGSVDGAGNLFGVGIDR
jgi:hypothetical protein